MPVIEVSGLTKTFRTYKKQPGFSGAIRGLFKREYEQVAAVSNVSFKIEPGEPCLVAEDVMTRGGRIQETIDIVQARGGVVTGVALLVDRSAGKVQMPVPVYSLIQMAPVTWQPSECPLCKQGTKAEHPGS